MRARLLVAAGTAALALGGSVFAASPAMAGDLVGNTDVTFTVSGNGIAIATDATSAPLGTVTSTALGATAAGSLPAVTITDARAGTTGWQSQVSSTGFSDAASDTIAPGQAKVFVGSAPTTVNGVAVATAGAYVSAATGLALSSTAATLVSTTSLTGSNEVTYTPSISITIASNVIAGDYSGVVAQTVV